MRRANRALLSTILETGEPIPLNGAERLAVGRPVGPGLGRGRDVLAQDVQRRRGAALREIPDRPEGVGQGDPSHVASGEAP